MKIVYIYHEKIDDKNTMSGTVNSIYEMLINQGHEVIVISGLKSSLLSKAYNKLKYKILRKHNINMNMNHRLLKSYARQIKRRLKDEEYDLVFAPLSSYYAYYVDKKPTCFFIDSNFAGLVDYYWPAENYTSKAIKDGYMLEEMALKNCSLAIYASNWARNSAISGHNGDPNKIVAINRGANIRHNFSKEEIEKIINNRNFSKQNGKCNLMFIGKDWERKRGRIACEVVKELNNRGLEAKLIVIGCTPKIEKEYIDYVSVIGFLDKNNKNDYKKLESYFKNSDFFILPTQAEAQGISYIESCSWGLPPIGCDTGGVSDVVIENVTGVLMEVNSRPSEYVNKILYYYNNPKEYIKLSNSSYLYCTQNMTWSAVGNRIFNEINKRIIEVK